MEFFLSWKSDFCDSASITGNMSKWRGLSVLSSIGEAQNSITDGSTSHGLDGQGRAYLRLLNNCRQMKYRSLMRHRSTRGEM
jgi:hypothetical protein